LFEHKQFESYRHSIFYKKTLCNNIEYVLKEIRGSDIDKKVLKNCYDKYESDYKSLINEYLKPKINLTRFMGNFKNIIYNLKITDSKKINWNSKIEENLPKIFGHVFALWTLLSSKPYLDISKLEHFLQPHPAQVIGTLLVVPGVLANFLI
jgi:hypothetical protein